MPTVARKKKIGTQIDPALHRRLKVLSALTGRRIDSLVEDAIRNLTVGIPEGKFVTLDEMVATYERDHGIKIDIEAEARKMQAKLTARWRKRSRS